MSHAGGCDYAFRNMSELTVFPASLYTHWPLCLDSLLCFQWEFLGSAQQNNKVSLSKQRVNKWHGKFKQLPIIILIYLSIVLLMCLFKCTFLPLPLVCSCCWYALHLTNIFSELPNNHHQDQCLGSKGCVSFCCCSGDMTFKHLFSCSIMPLL